MATSGGCVMEAKKSVVFVEGEGSNELRQGFAKLFKKEVKIIMGGARSETIKKFLNAEKVYSPQDYAGFYLLIDLDRPPAASDEREEDPLCELKKDGLETYAGRVFYMIQEMEGWFYSQPALLSVYFKQKINCPPFWQGITNPSDKLREDTRKINPKRPYHKVQDGGKILQLLDRSALMRDSVDFEGLMTVI